MVCVCGGKGVGKGTEIQTTTNAMALQALTLYKGVVGNPYRSVWKQHNKNKTITES